MVKSPKVTYSDAERFDAEFKKRQCEITNEISIWSQSESFRTRVREVARTAINDHDELVNLSRRLFENGVFASNFRELTKNEMEANTHKTWMERTSKWLWLGAGGVIVFFTEFFIKKCF